MTSFRPCPRCHVNKIPTNRRVCKTCRKSKSAPARLQTRAEDVLIRTTPITAHGNKRRLFTTASCQSRIQRITGVHPNTATQQSALFVISSEMADRLNNYFSQVAP